MPDISLEGSTIPFETKNRRLNHHGNFVVAPLTAIALAIDTSSISPILRKYGDQPILEISGYPVSHMLDALALQLRFHFSMEKWWKNKEKVNGPWKNRALFLFFSKIWKQRNFFLCSSTVFPWKNRNPVAVWLPICKP